MTTSIYEDPDAVCMHELHPATCTICKIALRRRGRPPKGFPATFAGVCSVNGDRIYPGDMIAKRYGGFAHSNCD